MRWIPSGNEVVHGYPGVVQPIEGILWKLWSSRAFHCLGCLGASNSSPPSWASPGLEVSHFCKLWNFLLPFMWKGYDTEQSGVLNMPSALLQTEAEGKGRGRCCSLTASPWKMPGSKYRNCSVFPLLAPCSSKEEKLCIQFSYSSLRSKKREWGFISGGQTSFKHHWLGSLSGHSQGSTRCWWFLYAGGNSVGLDQHQLIRTVIFRRTLKR